jgi:hypothetical protein
MNDSTAWIIPTGFLGGGLMSGWVGYGHWHGLLWAALGCLSAFVLGVLYEHWQQEYWKRP